MYGKHDDFFTLFGVFGILVSYTPRGYRPNSAPARIETQTLTPTPQAIAFTTRAWLRLAFYAQVLEYMGEGDPHSPVPAFPTHPEPKTQLRGHRFPSRRRYQDRSQRIARILPAPIRCGQRKIIRIGKLQGAWKGGSQIAWGIDRMHVAIGNYACVHKLAD